MQKQLDYQAEVVKPGRISTKNKDPKGANGVWVGVLRVVDPVVITLVAVDHVSTICPFS